MPCMKTAGWDHLRQAMEDSTDAANEYLGASDGDNLLARALAGVAYGADASLQELYERLERLHQKIDRIEKKIGSIPGSK